MKLVTDPNAPVLRKRAKKVTNPQSTEVILAVQTMKREALDWEQRNPGMYCAGLAAPQIGVSLRIVILRIKDAGKAPQNPEVLTIEQAREIYGDGVGRYPSLPHLPSDQEYQEETRAIRDANTRYNVACAEYREWKKGPGANFDPFLVLYNPKYADGDGMMEVEEGCLSVPGMLAKTMRRQKSAFWFYDQNLRRCPKEGYFEAEGLDSAIVSHELEHLDGTLCFDNAVSRRKLGGEPEIVEQGVDEDALEIAREVAAQDADILEALKREEAVDCSPCGDTWVDAAEQENAA